MKERWWSEGEVVVKTWWLSVPTGTVIYMLGT